MSFWSLFIFIFGLSLLVALHELGHMLAARAVGVRVTKFAIGFGPPIVERKFGQTAYSLRPIPLGGFAKMAGMNALEDGEDQEDTGLDTYDGKSAWRKAVIIFAGPLANIIVAVVILTGIYIVSGVSTTVEPVVQQTSPGTLAARAGLESGDKLVAFDGQRVTSWEIFQDEVDNASRGDRATLVVERDGERIEVSGQLTKDPTDPGGESAIVGIQPRAGDISHSPLIALQQSVERTAQIVWLILIVIFQLLTGGLSLFNSVSGPIGIATVGSQSISGGFFFQILAFISINLAVFNLLPILPLDGGHLLFIAIEKIRGRPVSAETLGKVATFGLLLFAAIMIFATYADISKLMSGQGLLK